LEKVIVFGRGKLCKTKWESVKKSYDIICIIDNNVERHIYDESFACDVYNPDIIKEYNNCKIICMSIYCAEMYTQLKELGISDERILFGLNYEPHSEGFEQIAFRNGQSVEIKEGKLQYLDEKSNCYFFKSIDELRRIVCNISSKNNPVIKSIREMPVDPVSRVFGLERGTAVDRYYIEKFLELNKDDIKGEVIEIDSNVYTRRYGKNKVTNEIKLHVFGWNGARKGNFETGEGLTDEMADCLICTQTLQYIYNLESAMKNIYRILKPEGVALITVPGIKSLSLNDDNNWGEKWSFTKKSMTELCQNSFGEGNYLVNTYGNVKVTVAYLYGLCYEDLSAEDFLYNDKQYPFIITARVCKNKKV